MVRASRRKPSHRRGYVLNALAFSTLLSSQGAGAHLQRTLVRLQGNYSNLPDGLPLLSTKFLRTFRVRLGCPSAQRRLPDKLPWSCEACQSEFAGGSRGGPVCRLAFRSPAGKKNFRDGRGPRQIVQRCWRRLTLDLNVARSHKPRSQAVRAAPRGPKNRSGFTAGRPERADSCWRLGFAIPGSTRPETREFLRHNRRSEPSTGRRGRSGRPECEELPPGLARSHWSRS